MTKPSDTLEIGTVVGQWGANWLTYTPTISGTGWALGNAVQTARYTRAGKTIFWQVRIVWGSTSTFGTGQLLVSLPITAVSATAEQTHVWGTHSGVGSNLLFGAIASTTMMGLYSITSAVGALGILDSTHPFTWANTDILYIQGFYEAA